jgi:hypothetical protein
MMGWTMIKQALTLVIEDFQSGRWVWAKMKRNRVLKNRKESDGIAVGNAGGSQAYFRGRVWWKR